jgi:hypothetical protein
MRGRKLWESKDEKLWVHEFFYEHTKGDDSFSTKVGFALNLFC